MPITHQKAHIETPVGVLEIRGTAQGVSEVVFLQENPEAFEQHEDLQSCTEQLKEYFNGERTGFHSLALKYAATPFQEDVWTALMDIPFGEVISYGELAKRAGHDGAARAVGTAMNVNPLPIIIPCHRVLPADKTLGQYAFGSQKKQWLLRHESVTLS